MSSKRIFIFAMTLSVIFMLVSGCRFFSRDIVEKDSGLETGSADPDHQSSAPGIDRLNESSDKSNGFANLTGPMLFQEGYARFEAQDYETAAAIFFRYRQSVSPDDSDYQWSAFFLGVSLKRLGFSHAAADILADLVARNPNPKIVTYCLEMFEIMDRNQPIDRDLIIDQVVCDQSYDFAEGELANFIHFYQGAYDWQHGFSGWGDVHFQQITPDSYYYYQYLYQRALRHVQDDEIDAAIQDFKTILRGSTGDHGLHDRVKKNLARLLYERGEYVLADEMYQDIERSLLKQSETLLERAWAHYRMGNAEKAMGLLYAFEAPSFEIYFTPEYYLLKSFIYKDVCHYRRALSIVDEFRKRYAAALENIYSRGDMTENQQLLLLLLHKEGVRRTWDFLNLLTAENESLRKFSESGSDPELSAFLGRLYALQLTESRQKLRRQMLDAYENYADELLKYEEEANLMAYEIGLDMYQRVQQYHYGEEAVKVSEEKGKIVVYPFQSEFWNDELSDYRVELPNKCNQAEEWDIFFK